MQVYTNTSTIQQQQRISVFLGKICIVPLMIPFLYSPDLYDFFWYLHTPHICRTHIKKYLTQIFLRETDTNHCCLMSDSFVTDFHSSIELNVSSSLSPSRLDHRLLDMALNRQNVTINSFWKYHDQNSSLFSSSCYFSV